MRPSLVTLLAVVLSGTQADAQEAPQPPRGDRLGRSARDFGDPRAQLEAAGQPGLSDRQPGPGGLLLFVSRGLPAGELAAAIAAARADRSITLVVRGLMPGETFQDTLGAWSRILGRQQVPPALVIDPTLYRRYAVTSVPILLDAATGRPPRAFPAAPVLPGGFFSDPAGTFPIAEPDLGNVLRGLAAHLDLPARGKAALARFWQQVAATSLPPATSTRTRRHRPFAQTANDLRDAQGGLILPAGTLINPLEQVPLTSTILVIDGQSPTEIAWARDQAGQGRHPIILIANPDRSGGWDAWQRLQEELGQPVFLLERTLALRLGVQVTPSRIEAHGLDLVITEMSLAARLATTGRATP